MAFRVNKKRLALSLGIVGAVVVPLWSGSLKRAAFSPPVIASNWDDRDRFVLAHGGNPVTCQMEDLPDHGARFGLRSIDTLSPEERDEEVKLLNICAQAENVPRNNAVYIYASKLTQIRNKIPFIRDVLAGFFLPALFVLLIPTLMKAYIRWVTG